MLEYAPAVSLLSSRRKTGCGTPQSHIGACSGEEDDGDGHGDGLGDDDDKDENDNAAEVEEAGEEGEPGGVAVVANNCGGGVGLSSRRLPRPSTGMLAWCHCK